ncbi:pilus assembly FimT family protein [Massilia suwonensis]|uniref:Tfp pilus assembly protein FimT/FimU n=1 Tax=Massilia suwonensis TaxID=648895 RepID=A0ABW0MNI0_9BURK
MRMLVARGFTLLEALIALAILGVVLSVGMPRMADWIYASKVAAAGQFYAEAFALARNQALTQNGVSRLVFSKNAGNGQYDWQIDLCFPRSDEPCNDISPNWSSAANPATRDPLGAKGFKSLQRSAEALPPAADLVPALGPEGANAVYFTPVGWVDPAIGPRIERIALTPGTKRAAAARPLAVVLTMAGNAIRCNPLAAAGDLQRCPP